jgi:outer membrane protein, heavy metal efflux system
MNKLNVLFISALLTFCAYGQNTIRSLSINQAVNIGLQNNPEIKSAKESINAAGGRFWSGISLPQPEVGISYDFTPLHSNLSSFGERTLEIRQSLEFPSNYFLKANMLSKAEKISAHKLTVVERNIVNRIKTSYCRVLLKKYQLQYADENLSISDDFLRKAQIRTNVGEGTNLEKLTALVQYGEAQNNLEIIKNELINAFAELNYSLGFGKQNYDSNYVLTDSMVFIDHKLNYEEIEKSFEENNPQIKIAGLNSRIASIELDLAWSSILPNINIAYFRQSRDGINGFYGASFGVSVPLWFMFEQRGKIQEAAANKSASLQDQIASKNELKLNLQSANTDHQNNLRQVKFYRNKLLPQARAIYNTAIKSYEAGELSYIEFLQAKQTLINAGNNYANTLFNYYLSVFRIEEITGVNIFEKTDVEK